MVTSTTCYGPKQIMWPGPKSRGGEAHSVHWEAMARVWMQGEVSTGANYANYH